MIILKEIFHTFEKREMKKPIILTLKMILLSESCNQLSQKLMQRFSEKFIYAASESIYYISMVPFTWVLEAINFS